MGKVIMLHFCPCFPNTLSIKQKGESGRKDTERMWSTVAMSFHFLLGVSEWYSLVSVKGKCALV